LDFFLSLEIALVDVGSLLRQFTTPIEIVEIVHRHFYSNV